MKKAKVYWMASSAAAVALAGAMMLPAQQSSTEGSVSTANRRDPGAGGNPTPTPSTATDPGPRGVSVGAGGPLPGLSAAQLQFFQNGLTRFMTPDSVSGTEPGEPNGGLGPTFNSNSCSSCHAQPAVGGSSPSLAAYPNIGPNPQIAIATEYGATNTIPSFITANGPVREARFPYMVNSNGTRSTVADGGVHDIFTITGRQDSNGCTLAQPSYDAMQQINNLIFRIPTPVFGAGLIENIPDATIVANMNANASLKRQLGIAGHPNYSGNDGTITRFGWKAQNKSLEIFSGEAYNVEMGVTNEEFPNERGDVTGNCAINNTPEDATNFSASGEVTVPSDVIAFSDFMRMSAPPVPSLQGIPGNPSAATIAVGAAAFVAVHCDQCHTPAMTTGVSHPIASILSGKTAALFSDLLVHNMGTGLADNVSQGSAAGNEFRTAPLWGVGQRVFFLHDGRSGPSNGGLMNAIQAHSSSGSEANQVIASFNQLPAPQQQALLDFLRSL
jgi:CxxC motif-containing protein (DUF1111 family)